ncbi:EpsG family protein [Pelagerythrobacter aerophilus]
MALLKVYLVFYAVGGVDIDVYWFESPRVDYTHPRYYREPISWFLLGSLADTFGRAEFVLAFSGVIFLISVLRLGIFGGLILYVSFLSPFGIMLELNILRQCLGTIFVIFCILSLTRERIGASAIFAAIAILSHNSSIMLLILVVFAHYFMKLRSEFKGMAFFLLCILVVTLYMIDALDLILGGRAESFRADAIDGGPENVIYVIFAEIMCVLVFFFSEQRKWRPISIALAGGVMLSVGVTILLSLDSWVYGRISISVVVICQFLLLYGPWVIQRLSARNTFLILLIVSVNGIAILFHPGAMGMIATGYR